jgi:hypothetical protein
VDELVFQTTSTDMSPQETRENQELVIATLRPMHAAARAGA